MATQRETDAQIDELAGSERGAGATDVARVSEDRARVPPGIMKLAEQFVKLVFDLPQVQRVMLEVSDDGVTIWTVIDAIPKDTAYRYPVYERQAKVLAAVNYMSDDVPDFRLINVREFGDRAQSVLPDAVRIWDR